MRYKDSFEYFNKLKTLISVEDINTIADICKALHLPQKTLSISWYLYYAIKAESKIEPDDVVLVSAIINLASKLCETIRPVEKILHLVTKKYKIEMDPSILELYIISINKTETETVCIIDFDFEITEIYYRLEKLCIANKFNALLSKRCWITLNDIMSFPFAICFTIEEILVCIVFINYACTELISKSTDSLYDIFNRLTSNVYLPRIPYDYIEPICEKIMLIYDQSFKD